MTFQVSIPEPPPSRPTALLVIGWTCLVLALLRFTVDLLGWLIWQFGGLRETIPVFLPFLRFRDVDRRIPSALLGNFGNIAAAQGIASGIVAIVSFNFLRLRRWARKAMEVMFWIGLVAVVLAPILLFLFPSKEPAGTMPPGTLVGTGVVGAVLGVVFSVAIWNLRQRPIREAFDGPPQESS